MIYALSYGIFGNLVWSHPSICKKCLNQLLNSNGQLAFDHNFLILFTESYIIIPVINKWFLQWSFPFISHWAYIDFAMMLAANYVISPPETLTSERHVSMMEF